MERQNPSAISDSVHFYIMVVYTTSFLLWYFGHTAITPVLALIENFKFEVQFQSFESAIFGTMPDPIHHF